jgi:hypothetical protein
VRAARLLPLLVALAALTLVPSRSLADGDPASDVLLANSLYTPVAQKISPPVLKQLQSTMTQADAGGFQVRVALILDRTDLGAVPQLFGHPAKYVKLLASELFYAWKGTVIAVQPSGIGVQNIKPLAPAQTLVDSIDVARPATADSLAQAASTAIRKLASEESGVQFESSAPGSGDSSSTFSTPRIAGGVLVLVVVLVCAGLLVVRHRRRATPDA